MPEILVYYFTLLRFVKTQAFVNSNKTVKLLLYTSFAPLDFCIKGEMSPGVLI